MSVHDEETPGFTRKIPAIFLRITADRRLAEEWALVLTAEGLSPAIHSTANGFVITVPEPQAADALRALSAYDIENSPTPDRLETPRPPNWFAGVITAELLLGFYALTTMRDTTIPWLERGSADSARIAAGEVWRAVTALTLHADIGHVLSNAVAAALFFSAVFGATGTGVGSALLLLAGAGGNLVNAFVHGSEHVAVGASTAIFSAVGMLGGMAVIRPVVRRTRRWLGAGAALALLAMLGTGGPHVDVLAHLFGFILGGIMGLITARVSGRPPGPAIQYLSGSASVGLLIYCWLLALR